MNKNFNRLICTLLSAVILLSGCAENTDASKGGPEETETVTTAATSATEATEAETTTTAEETTEPTETTKPEATTTITTAVTETLSPDGGFKNFGEYKDENGEVLLEVTDGMKYVDYIAYYHGYFKVTNVSDKTVTDLREKIAAIGMFSDTVEMMIEYPYGDNCVDIIKWENGKPDFENMKQYFDAMAQREYTFDNTLAPDEYCIISVTFTNGAEITTAAEAVPDQTSAYTETTTTTKAPETTTEKKTVATTAPVEDETPENTTERPLDDPIYNKYMPSDKIIKEAAEIAAKDGDVIIAIYEDDTYEVMTSEEMEAIKDVLVVESIISEESYNDMLEMYEEYPELAEDGSTAFLSDYQSFVQFWLESFPDCKDYFDENGKPLVNTDPCFAVSFTFDGEDGKVKLEEVAETTIRWAFAQRTDDKNFNYLVDEAHKSLLGDSVYVRCTYNGGKTAHAKFIYYSHSIMFDPEVTLTF